MEYILVIGLIVVNLGWLYLWDRQEKRNKDERRELHNRIALPEMIVEDEETLRAEDEREMEVAEKFAEMTQLTEVEQAEYAAVGQVNPNVIDVDRGR